jgi:hypothetical protein
MNSPTRPRGGTYDNATPLQYVLTDSDARKDIPATEHCNSYLFPPFAPPLAPIKGREGQPSQGLAEEPNTHSKGLWHDTLSRPVWNPYYKQP